MSNKEIIKKYKNINYKGAMLTIILGAIAIILLLGEDYRIGGISYEALYYGGILLVIGFCLGYLLESVYMQSLLHDLVFDERPINDRSEEYIK